MRGCERMADFDAQYQMIILSWPPAALSPNAHVFWATKARAVKSYRKAAGWATVESKDRVDGDGLIDIHITFYPPDLRKRDGDNMLASFKSGLDGIADGLGVNDNRFRIRYEIGAVIKGGEVRVIVTITPIVVAKTQAGLV